MGRPPSNGGPSFRFNHTEVVEMEAILQAHNAQMPSREVLDALAEKFSTSAERSGKVVVQMKQIWSWFQNRRYAIRAKAGKPPVKLAMSTPENNSTTMKNTPLAPQLVTSSTAPMKSVAQNTKITAAPPVQDAARYVSESQMEFEARSARDGAWYDVASFISHRSIETGDPGVLVRFAGFGPEEDEWVNVRKHIRQRSLPCESSECIVVLPGDLILCFQEGKEEALYYDAHILDSQRRRHDVRGCRCRFLVRYDHDQSEEIVPLRKICRRPETDHRLQQLDFESGKVNQQRTGADPVSNNTTKGYPPTKTAQKDQKLDQTSNLRACSTVALDVSQPIAGSHHHSGHIAKVDQNSESTQPPVADTGSDTADTHMLPSPDSNGTDVAKLNQTSAMTRLPPLAETCSDIIASQVLPATESYPTIVAKVHEISLSTQMSVAETGLDAVANHVFPTPDSHATDVSKVNLTSDMRQLSPLAETGSDSMTTQVLPATISCATIVAKADKMSDSTQQPVAEVGSNTVATHMLPSPDSHVANVNQTSEMTLLQPLAESGSESISTLAVPATGGYETTMAKVHQISKPTQPPVEEIGSDNVATRMVPTPENNAAVIAAATSQNTLPIPS